MNIDLPYLLFGVPAEIQISAMAWFSGRRVSTLPDGRGSSWLLRSKTLYMEDMK
jgi:hypothetical protein